MQHGLFLLSEAMGPRVRLQRVDVRLALPGGLPDVHWLWQRHGKAIDWIWVKSKCICFLNSSTFSAEPRKSAKSWGGLIIVIRPSRYFLTARASATWWPQAWTCRQCWASVPGRATVITSSKSTWLCLHWAPSFPPAGLRRDTSFCSGLSFKDSVTLQRENIIHYIMLYIMHYSFTTGCGSSLCQIKCCYCLPDPFIKTWNHWLWECKHL